MRGNNLNNIPLVKRNSSDTRSELQQLRAELRNLKRESEDKHSEMADLASKLRCQGVMNQKLKKQVVEVDERAQQFSRKQIQYFLEKYKDNKNSPLFYNQNGLSPFELLRIGEAKHEQMMETNICMVCFVDLKGGDRIMKLPCQHLLHKECGIQHLLYSSQCPACSQNLK